MSNWKEYIFSDFVNINPTVSLNGKEEYSYVEMKDLQNGNKICSPSAERKVASGARFQERDTLFAKITPCLENGKICQVRGLKNGIGFGSTEFLVFRGKQDISDNDYVFYLSRWDEVRGFAEGNFEGTSGRQRVPKNCFDNLLLELPDHTEQIQIANILSSLDDKIDLLHRQNKTLEQLAETLFKQWFVQEADGNIVKLGEAIRTSSGGTPSRSKMEYYSNGTIKWVKSKELNGGFIFETEELVTDEAVKNSSAKLFPANTILIAMYGATVGEYGILAEPATCNQAICALIPNENYPYTFLFILTKINKEIFINMAVGSAQQNISQELIQELEIPKSTKRIEEFHIEVEPMFQKIKSNTNQIRTLSQLRDALLPKLMSGEVRLKN
jgi:type I restriction enzyme, S subunit